MNQTLRVHQNGGHIVPPIVLMVTWNPRDDDSPSYLPPFGLLTTSPSFSLIPPLPKTSADLEPYDAEVWNTASLGIRGDLTHLKPGDVTHLDMFLVGG